MSRQFRTTELLFSTVGHKIAWLHLWIRVDWRAVGRTWCDWIYVSILRLHPFHSHSILWLNGPVNQLLPRSFGFYWMTNKTIKRERQWTARTITETQLPIIRQNTRNPKQQQWQQLKHFYSFDQSETSALLYREMNNTLTVWYLSTSKAKPIQKPYSFFWICIWHSWTDWFNIYQLR